MPDTQMMDQASDTTRTRKGRQSGSELTLPASEGLGIPIGEVRRTVHVTLQNKGGVGKTLVASNIAQYLIEKNRPVVAFDVDPGNHSLADIKLLRANIIDPFNSETGEVNISALDELMEAALTEPADVVIDGGAASFQPLADYLIRMDAAAVLAERGRDLLVHSVIAGGASFEHTLTGVEELLTQIPAPARFVIWLNEYFGPIGAAGENFEETTIYKTHRERIAGIVRISRRGRYFSDDIARMLAANLTYDEAIGSAMVMPAQRLIQVRRGLWDQMSHVL